MSRARLFSANLGLVALVLLDVPLVVAAIHHGRGHGGELPSASAAAQAPVQPSIAPPTPETAAVTARRPRQPVMLSFSGPLSGWRVHPGCGRAPHLTATTDGGKHWRALQTPAAHVLRIVQTGATTGWMVGADAQCVPAFLSTSDGGATWTAGTGLGEAWVVIDQRLRLPNGTTTAPCGPNEQLGAVAPASVTLALVACSSSLLVTTDGGASWNPVGRFPQGGQAVAIGMVPGSAGKGVALLTGSKGCPAGLAVAATDDGGDRWHSGGCLDALRPPAAVSLAVDGSGYLLAAGGAARTMDAGRTWTSS
ncbi:MAG TPA: hypothetical protein VG650_10125 [Mycobacteriales bacterium]|nr:hypothetical protein [Mycobacteriales bacterium]